MYAAGAPCCPQCRATEHTQEEDMPRITAAEGPSNAFEPVPDETVPAVADEAVIAPEAEAEVPAATLPARPPLRLPPPGDN